MERHAHECSVLVYFCATVEGGISELYQKNGLPEEAKQSGQRTPLEQVHQNVRTLLDEDLGGFQEGKAPLMRVYECHATDAIQSSSAQSQINVLSDSTIMQTLHQPQS